MRQLQLLAGHSGFCLEFRRLFVRLLGALYILLTLLNLHIARRRCEALYGVVGPTGH